MSILCPKCNFGHGRAHGIKQSIIEIKMLFISRNDTHQQKKTHFCANRLDCVVVYSAAAKGVIDCYSLQELLFSQIKFCSTQTHKGLLLQKLHFQYRKKTCLLPGKVISAGSVVIIV